VTHRTTNVTATVAVADADADMIAEANARQSRTSRLCGGSSP
jgi:hypothetical protein